MSKFVLKPETEQLVLLVWLVLYTSLFMNAVDFIIH